MPHSRGRYVKRRKVAPKNMSKKTITAFKRIARAVVKQNEETKYFKWTDATQTVWDGIVSWNLFHMGVTRGTGDNQLLGDQLRWKGVAIKYEIVNKAINSTVWTYNDQPILLDFMIVRANTFKTTQHLTPAELATDTTTDLSLLFVNPERAKILYKKTITIKPDRSALNSGSHITRLARTGKIWLKRNQLIRYIDFDANLNLKDTKNYYFCILNRSEDSNQTPYIALSCQNYFTDS